MALLEHRYEKGEIDIVYGDESQISEEGYVPYGWQFKDEDVCVVSSKSTHINCFGLISRGNRFFYKTTTENITSDFIIEQLDMFSFSIKKESIVILDNAKIHRSKKMIEMQKIWASRNLFIFFLPPYSPHLNIIERHWKELKARWLDSKYYIEADLLYYQTKLILDEVGKSFRINYKPFKINSN